MGEKNDPGMCEACIQKVIEFTTALEQGLDPETTKTLCEPCLFSFRKGQAKASGFRMGA